MRPALSVTIPVRNSAPLIERTIEAARAATSLSIELIVADGGSTDATMSLAKSLGARTIEGNYKILAARRRAAEAAQGDVVVLLDADQLLQPGALDIAYQSIADDGFDMIALGERVAAPSTLYQRLSDADKRLLELDVERQLDPERGVIMPRVFRRELLISALSRIPPSADDVVIAMDHAMIYRAARQLSEKVAYQASAVLHREPSTLREVWRKNYRYGWSVAAQREKNVSVDLIRSKTRRRLSHGPLSLRAASLAFVALKLPAIVLGAGDFELRRRFAVRPLK